MSLYGVIEKKKSLTCVFEQIAILCDYSENLLEVQKDWTTLGFW